MTFVTTNERLGALIATLQQGGEIDTETRRQLTEAMYDLGLYHAIEERKRKRGTPVAAKTWLAAAIALRLVGDYKVKVRDAVFAAAPKADPDECLAIERAYRKLKSGAFTLGINLHPDLVAEAADRVPKYQMEKALAKQQKSGNK